MPGHLPDRAGCARDVAAALVLLAACGAAAAQSPRAAVSDARTVGYPTRALRIVVNAPPGGGTDILARAVAARLADAWGVQAVIDNRGGGGGIVGSEVVARALPDGYTLLVTFTSHVINPSLYRKLPYDTLADFAPVSSIGTAPNLLVVHPSVPVTSVKELIGFARARPRTLNSASAGSGSASHLALVLFNIMASTDIQHVPYKGASPGLTDLIGGQVTMMFGNITSTLPHVRVKRLHSLGVSSLARLAAMPEFPTIDEAGLKGFEAVAWFGMFAPAGTPDPVVRKLNAEVVRALQSAEVRTRLVDQGAEPAPSTPEALAAYVKSEIAKWAKVVKASGATAD